MGQKVSPYERAYAQDSGQAALSTGAALGVTFFAALLAAGAVWLAIHWQSSERALDATRASLSKLQGTRAQSDEELRALRQDKQRLDESLQVAATNERELSLKLAAAETRLAELEQEHSIADARLEEMRKMASRFESMIDSGQLQVAFRRGRMVVELPAQLLFPSGSADLTKEGSAALVQVAEILREVRKRRFLVFGHTDSVPVTSAQFKSNWELSVARALHVTEALIDAGVPPQQLLAAGRAQYEPIASNATPSGRQKNRRIEIVLEPQLVEPGSTVEDIEAAEAQ